MPGQTCLILIDKLSLHLKLIDKFDAEKTLSLVASVRLQLENDIFSNNDTKI